MEDDKINMFPKQPQKVTERENLLILLKDQTNVKQEKLKPPNSDFKFKPQLRKVRERGDGEQ